jgi:anti-sigma B factor antagonist
MSQTPGVDLIPIEKTRGAIVARLQVKMLDQRALNALERAVDQASETEPRAPLVILDLARVAIVPSLALAVLMQLAGRCAGRQQRLKLVAVQPQIRKVFALTRLDEVFQFADTVESAME